MYTVRVEVQLSIALEVVEVVIGAINADESWKSFGITMILYRSENQSTQLNIQVKYPQQNDTHNDHLRRIFCNKIFIHRFRLLANRRLTNGLKNGQRRITDWQLSIKIGIFEGCAHDFHQFTTLQHQHPIQSKYFSFKFQIFLVFKLAPK